MKNKEFDRGREYESKLQSMRLHLWLGYGMAIGSIIFSIGYFITGSPSSVYTSLFMIIFGLIGIFLGHREKKELNKYENKKKKKMSRM